MSGSRTSSGQPGQERSSGSGSWGAVGRHLWPILKQSVRDLLVDNGPQWAAAISYYSALSLFPLLILAAAIAAYFVDPQWAIDRATSLLGDYLPQGRQTVQQVVKDAINNRGQFGFFAGIGLLWSGTRVFAALTKALNVASGRSQQYGFLARLVVEGAMLLTIGAVFSFALLSGYVFDLIWRLAEHASSNPTLVIQAATWTIRALLMLGAYYLIYQYVPRGRQNPRASLVGAVTATVLFLIADPIFRTYVSSTGKYNLIYGSLAVVIIVLVWIWLVALITLFGGEVAAHTRSIAFEGLSAAEVGRRHGERAQPPRPAQQPSGVTQAIQQGAIKAGQAGNLLDELGDRVQRLVDRIARQRAS